MNSYAEVDGAAHRRECRLPHRHAPRRPRLRGRRGRGLLRRRVPRGDARGGRRPGRGRGAGARGRHRHRAARPGTRTCSRWRTASVRAPSTSATSTAPCSAPSRRRRSSGCSTRARSRTSPRRRSTSTRRATGRSRAVSRRNRSCSWRTTACCRSGTGAVRLTSVAVIGPNADRAEALQGCYSFANHVLASHPDLPLGFEIPTVLESLPGAFRAAGLPVPGFTSVEGCAVEGDDESGVPDAVRAAQSSPTSRSWWSATRRACSGAARSARATTPSRSSCPASSGGSSRRSSRPARPSSSSC